MRFIDLHAHHVCKTLFNNYSPWEFIKASDRILGNILGSQANLTEMATGNNCNLLCMTLSPVETGMLDQWLLKLAPFFTDALDEKKIKRMISGEDDYYHLLFREKDNLFRKPGDPSMEKKPVRILRSFNEYKKEDFSTLYVIFNIEGGHVFYNDCNRHNNIEEILQRFITFVRSDEFLVLYITPAHLTPNIFITHAYSNKIFGKGKLLPKGYGIKKPEGELFLNEIINSNLLIDVKHMSLISRQLLYKETFGIKGPLICSHAGLTGCSWNDRLNRKIVLDKIKPGPGFVKIRYIKPRGMLKGTYFNPCSVNLYNEDIVAILKTRGLIGIQMDLRIMGGDRNLCGNLKVTEKEFVSQEEFEEWKEQTMAFFPLTDNDFEFPYEVAEWKNGELTEDIRDEEDIEDELEELNYLTRANIENFYLGSFSAPTKKTMIFRDRSDEHSRYFANQILYIVHVAQTNALPVNPWKHICIGSDFDGYVRAIDPCRNAAEISDFGQKLITKLEDFANEAKIELPCSAQLLIEDILHNNLYDFIRTYFENKVNFTTDTSDGKYFPE